MCIITCAYVPATHQAVVAQAVPEHVEDRVRLAALAKRVRTTEFFKDFDKLRTGYITSEYVVCDCVRDLSLCTCVQVMLCA